MAAPATSPLIDVAPRYLKAAKAILHLFDLPETTPNREEEIATASSHFPEKNRSSSFPQPPSGRRSPIGAPKGSGENSDHDPISPLRGENSNGGSERFLLKASAGRSLFFSFSNQIVCSSSRTL